MVLPLESSRTRNRVAFHSQRTRQWDWPLVSGMLTIGQQGEGLWRQIGAKRHSLLPTETLMPIRHVSGQGTIEHLHAALHHRRVLKQLVMNGSQKILIQLGRRGWDGCKRTTWSITTALIPRDFPRASLLNARHDDLRTPMCKLFDSIKFFCIYTFQYQSFTIQGVA